MLIYDELRKDHVKVLQLLDDVLELADGDNRHIERMIERIRDELIPHSRAEEAIFYNSIRSLNHARNIVAHSYEEHIAAETFLRMLQVKGKVHLEWKDTARKLKNALAHHIGEEEENIFPIARTLFTIGEAEMMGQAFVKLKRTIKDEGFSSTTLELAANLMPRRFSKLLYGFNLEARI